jgi:hypothetical protein
MRDGVKADGSLALWRFRAGAFAGVPAVRGESLGSDHRKTPLLCGSLVFNARIR